MTNKSDKCEAVDFSIRNYISWNPENKTLAL